MERLCAIGIITCQTYFQLPRGLDRLRSRYGKEKRDVSPYPWLFGLTLRDSDIPVNVRNIFFHLEAMRVRLKFFPTGRALSVVSLLLTGQKTELFFLSR